MFPILLAALSAATWGTGDYCGGRAARCGPVLGVTVLSQLTALPVVVVGVVLLGGHPNSSALAWGAGAGGAGFLGLVLLYRGLAGGAMALFAPTSAVTAALVPVGTGLLLGDRPGTLALCGVACAAIAIFLVGLGSGGEADGASARFGPRQLLLALLSGSLFGLFFVCMSRAGHHSGMWPLVGARTVATTLAVSVALRAGVRARDLVGPIRRWAVGAGICDIGANMLYLMASRGGLLSVVAPVGSLYPLSTMLLAVVIDGERLRATQVAGLGLAAAALVLVAT